MKYDENWQPLEGVLVPLPKPVFGGWERYFFVRPDAARSSEGPELERMLPLVQNRERSGRQDFALRDRRHGGKKRARPHQLTRLDDRTFQVLVPEQLRQHFLFVHERELDAASRRWAWRRFWTARHPWKFVSRVARFYHTHQWLPDAMAEAERRYLHDRLELYGPGRSYPLAIWMRQLGGGYIRHCRLSDKLPGWLPTEDDLEALSR